MRNYLWTKCDNIDILISGVLFKQGNAINVALSAFMNHLK